MKEPTSQPAGRIGVAPRFESPALLLVLLAVWLLATLGLRPLLQPDEGRYASVAREMLMGDALVPTLNGLPFFHKPPVFYWLDTAGTDPVSRRSRWGYWPPVRFSTSQPSMRTTTCWWRA